MINVKQTIWSKSVQIKTQIFSWEQAYFFVDGDAVPDDGLFLSIDVLSTLVIH